MNVPKIHQVYGNDVMFRKAVVYSREELIVWLNVDIFAIC